MPIKTKKLDTLIQRMGKLQAFYEAAANDLAGKALLILTTETPGAILRLEWQAEIRQLSGGGVVMRISNARVDENRDMWEKIMTWLNVGTTSHWVAPVVASALHWIDPETGEDRFSKGHQVSGIRGAHFMEHADRLIASYMRKLPSLHRRFMKTGALPG